MGFVDSYTLKWKLRNEFGDVWEENLDEVSLSDFEVIYGNNTNEIIEIKLELIEDGNDKI